VKGSLDRFRDFVHIGDAVSGLRCVGESQKADDGTYNLCTGVQTTVREVIENILDVVGGSWDQISVVGGTPGDQFGMQGDMSRLGKLGWKPKWSLQDGLAEMWDRR